MLLNSRPLKLALIGAWFAVVLFCVAADLDGWPIHKPLTTDAFLGVSDGYMFEYRAFAAAAALGWFLIVVPASATRWWDREAARWSGVLVTLVCGMPPCSCNRCAEGTSAATPVRYALLLSVIGALFGAAAFLELHKLDHSREVIGTGSGIQLISPVVELVCFGAVLIAAVAVPLLWSRPVARVSAMRLVMIPCFTVVFIAIASHSEAGPLMSDARLQQPYLESVAAVWLSAMGTILFGVAGWAAAERGLPQ